MSMYTITVIAPLCVLLFLHPPQVPENGVTWTYHPWLPPPRNPRVWGGGKLRGNHYPFSPRVPRKRGRGGHTPLPPLPPPISQTLQGRERASLALPLLTHTFPRRREGNPFGLPHPTRSLSQIPKEWGGWRWSQSLLINSPSPPPP